VAGKLIVESRFPQVKKAAQDTMQRAQKVWSQVGVEEAERLAASQAANRGYDNLDISVEVVQGRGNTLALTPTADSLKWGDDPWWIRFFEYGTVFIPAMPFLRPAASRANKAYGLTVLNDLEKNIRKKASVKR
jgi:hypothetical protein